MRIRTDMLLTAAVIAGLWGCGDNKTRQKLIGTELVTASSLAEETALPASDNPVASTVSALYSVAFVGAGAGSFTMAPRRMAPGATDGIALRTPSANAGSGLGTPDPQTGEYSFNDTTGVKVKVLFKSGVTPVIMNTSVIMDASGQTINTYASNDLDSAKIAMTSVSDLLSFFNTNLTATRYVPTFWVTVSGDPIAWFPITIADLQGNANDILAILIGKFGTFLLDNFPDSMTTTVSGTTAAGTFDLIMNSAMPQGKPTDENPVAMTGSGTITLVTGQVLTVTVSLSMGTSGPISGTQTFAANTGETGTLTFQSGGSMSGSISRAGVPVATFSIDTGGNGTFTDLATGQVYRISNARPSAGI